MAQDLGVPQHAITAYLPEPRGQRMGRALCLSGGGFRAALFHLGALGRLNDLGILSGLDTITSVSGGSIIAAHVATTLRPWPDAGTVILDWEHKVAGPFRAFAAKNIRAGWQPDGRSAAQGRDVLPLQHGRKGGTAMKNLRYVFYACAGLALWLLLFGMGIIVNSQPYRELVLQRFEWFAFLMAVASYTPTNTAVLAVVTGFVGGCGSLIFYGGLSPAASEGLSESERERMPARLEHPSSSAIRGFFGYLGIMAGAVVGSNQPFAATTPEQYWRLACSVSLLAFILGFDSTLFRGLVGTVGRRYRAMDQTVKDAAGQPGDQEEAPDGRLSEKGRTD